jgi:hypothetical protein
LCGRLGHPCIRGSMMRPVRTRSKRHTISANVCDEYRGFSRRWAGRIHIHRVLAWSFTAADMRDLSHPKVTSTPSWQHAQITRGGAQSCIDPSLSSPHFTPYFSSVNFTFVLCQVPLLSLFFSHPLHGSHFPHNSKLKQD